MKVKWIVLFVIVIFLLGSFLYGQSPELKSRFLKRKPVIETLKNQGKLGENNLGKLDPRSALNPEESRVVNSENEDREIVYRQIAQKLNVSPQEVGRRRAVQIAELAAPGHWLQNPQGHWYQKK